MKIAFITDIHANLEALDSVLSDIDKNEVSNIISLGDNVGYGPDPVKVLERLYERDIDSLLGNHDEAVIEPSLFDDASDYAVNAMEWTRYRLNQEADDFPDFQDILAAYFQAPFSSLLGDKSKVILAHGCPGPDKTRFDYLLEPQDLVNPFLYMKKKKLKICFFGHTHRQIFWEVDGAGVSLIEFDYDESIEFTDTEIKDSTLFINPGSVGQPRDKNPDASYVIYEQISDRHIFTFKRVEYDIETTIQKIYEIESLDDRLGDRLRTGS